MNIQPLLGQMRDALAHGQRIFMAVVVDHTRHSPGTRGAMMALFADGRLRGTIGGGIMEKQLLDTGYAVLTKASTHHQIDDLYHRKHAPGQRSGMICAGRQTNVSFVIEPKRDLPAIEAAIALVERDAAGTLTYTEGEGLSVEANATTDFDVRLLSQTPLVLEIGLLKLDRVAIFGGGHCGLALSKQMALLGYTVHVADIREDVPTMLANDVAHRVVVDRYEDAAQHIPHAAITPAIVMTADFPSDVAAIAGAFEQPFPFIGVMGARAKRVAILKALRQRGFTDHDLDRLTMPVGLSINSATPAEIAVSVAAQLITQKTTLFPSRQPSPFDPETTP